jgi:hypothetical protein
VRPFSAFRVCSQDESTRPAGSDEPIPLHEEGLRRTGVGMDGKYAKCGKRQGERPHLRK